MLRPALLLHSSPYPHLPSLQPLDILLPDCPGLRPIEYHTPHQCFNQSSTSTSSPLIVIFTSISSSPLPILIVFVFPIFFFMLYFIEIRFSWFINLCSPSCVVASIA